MVYTKPHANHLRTGRCSQPGLYYFLTASVAARRNIFIVPARARVVLDAIRWLHDADRFIVDAAVVMPDHFHMAGQLGQSTLAKVMHTLKSYSGNKLASTGIETPVWQKGYHDHGLRDDEDYKVKIRYLVDNPVRAGLVKQANDYPHIILPAWWPDN